MGTRDPNEPWTVVQDNDAAAWDEEAARQECPRVLKGLPSCVAVLDQLQWCEACQRARADALASGPGWQDGRIATMDAFHRAAREYRESLEAAREVDAQHEAEIAPLLAKLKAAQERAVAARKPIEDHARWLEGQLLGFAQTHRKDILKGRRHDAKSALLQSGVRVAWRHDPGGYRWDDSMKESERKAKLLEWALDETEGPAGAQGLIDAPPVPILDAIKAYADKIRIGDIHTRFVPPGLKYVEPADVLSITTDKDEP